MKVDSKLDMTKLREALEAAWKPDTAYLRVAEKGNSALGQCYPTSRVVQFYFPKTEIVEGQVWTGERLEKHFWNLLVASEEKYHIDFTWQQFPAGSTVRSYKVRDRNTLGDSEETIKRVELLKSRVEKFLG